MTEEGDDDTGVIPPKRLGLGRRILERNAYSRSTPTSSSDHLPIRVGQDSDRPTYSQDYIKELRQSTPSTPSTPKPPHDSGTENSGSNKTIDIAAKFGEVTNVGDANRTSLIPTEAEIREKKARRARLVKEQEYISLNDNGDEGDESDLEFGRQNQKEQSRLLRDDEDFAEGFDEFVEDGKISLGRKAEREQQRKQREQMRELINDAEDTSDEDDSDAERNAAYEAAQTRAAMGLERGLSSNMSKTAPKIASLPRLANVIELLRASLAEVEYSKTMLINRMEELRKEKADIAVREVEIQELIHEAGEKYEKLRIEAGLNPEENGLPGDNTMSDRGLESIGNSMPVSRVESDAEGV